MTDKVEFMKEMYQAFAQGLYASFADGGDEECYKYFDPDFVWVTAHNGWHFKGSPYLGIKSVWDNVFTHGGETFDPATYVVEVTEFIDVGPDTVIVLAYYTGNAVTSGEYHRIQVAHVWTLKNGRMKKFQQYCDTYKMANFDTYLNS